MFNIGCEGKAGMACISGADTSVNMDSLSQEVKNSLAPYARPLFLRFVPELEMTGTYSASTYPIKPFIYLNTV